MLRNAWLQFPKIRNWHFLYTKSFLHPYSNCLNHGVVVNRLYETDNLTFSKMQIQQLFIGVEMWLAPSYIDIELSTDSWRIPQNMLGHRTRWTNHHGKKGTTINATVSSHHILCCRMKRKMVAIWNEFSLANVHQFWALTETWRGKLASSIQKVVHRYALSNNILTRNSWAKTSNFHRSAGSNYWAPIILFV